MDSEILISLITGNSVSVPSIIVTFFLAIKIQRKMKKIKI